MNCCILCTLKHKALGKYFCTKPNSSSKNIKFFDNHLFCLLLIRSKPIKIHWIHMQKRWKCLVATYVVAIVLAKTILKILFNKHMFLPKMQQSKQSRLSKSTGIPWKNSTRWNTFFQYFPIKWLPSPLGIGGIYNLLFAACFSCKMYFHTRMVQAYSS